MKAASFFSKDDRLRISTAIEHAEKETSGVIRIYIEDKCLGDVLDRAAFIFSNLNMHKTSHRNGVLIYLALKHRKFAVIGDAGINSIVGNDFWNSVKELMLMHFKNNSVLEGIIAAIGETGKVLSQHFPYDNNDTNELSNDVIIK
jgi:uncharacterized membrane protein